ncbi:hypothetical protein CAEBREN_19953 [Caenorhabditis brenneri]|uniref:Uncharacterized protein n=1 Tax=Caenorhabditis brenneri TaxID=135651 RepID=G0PLY8_CAEBE|nr:hypothetical protein CAEBREN_19953 [Caenorhabditis brenneri]
MDPKIEKVEKELEELRKEQAATKKELQEMKGRAEAIQQNHQVIKALLARQAGTEALQAVFEARRVDDQAYQEVRRRHFDATAAYQDELMARLRQAGQAGTEALQAGTEARQAGTEARRVDDQAFEEVMRKHLDANAAWGADFMARLWQDGQGGTEARQAGTEALHAGTEARPARIDNPLAQTMAFMNSLGGYKQAGQAGTEARQAGTEALQAGTEARQQGGFDEALQESSLARMLALKRADQRRQARVEARQAEAEARQAGTEARQACTDNPLAQTMAHMNSFGGYKQAGQVGTEARQAATEARQARTDNPLAQTMALVNSLGGQRQANQADQANQAGKRRGGPGRPVGVKRDAKEVSFRFFRPVKAL